MFRKRFSRALAFTVISALVMASAAFANDKLTSDADLVAGGLQQSYTNNSLAAGVPDSFSFSLYVELNPGGSEPTYPIKVDIDSMPAWVAADTDFPVSIAGIGTANAVLVNFTATGQAVASSGAITFKALNGAGTEELGQNLIQTGAQSTFSVSVSPPAAGNAAPVVAADNASVQVNEGTPATNTGTWSDADAGDSVSLSASIGLVAQAGTNAGGTWSWSYTPDDGPIESQTVTITADDGTDTTDAQFDLIVDNVAPTASLSGPSIAIVGQEVTYSASADDVSDADDAAGFTFSFDGGTTWTASAAATAQFKTTFTSCGEKTVSVLAQDKDEGISDPASVTTNAFNATFLAPLKVGEVNLVQKGRVIPVQISVSCDGNISGLTPSIQLLNGDYVSGVDVTNSEDNLVTASVSNADTSGIMRAVDGKYLYNLQIPSTATTNQVMTIRVRPWGSSGPSLNILLQIRK